MCGFVVVWLSIDSICPVGSAINAGIRGVSAGKLGPPKECCW